MRVVVAILDEGPSKVFIMVLHQRQQLCPKSVELQPSSLPMVIDPKLGEARKRRSGWRAGQQQASLLCQPEHRVEEAHLLTSIPRSPC